MRKLILIAPVLLAACATDPSRIAAVDTPGVKCDPDRLAYLEAEQKKAARNDTIGVILFGLPVGSMSGGDHSKEIAALKGACS